jgi:pimeloyl-[acyl-carrier protein] synthase
MKRKLIWGLGQIALLVLRQVDNLFSGSRSGLSQQEALDNPYKEYDILRSRGPILRSYTNRGWMVLGFDEAQEVFRDQRFGSDLRKNKFLSNAIRFASNGRKVALLDDPTMLNLDPPDHTRLRKLVSHGFLHKHILSLEPMIKDIVTRCLNDYDASTGKYDIVTQIAKPLPAIVIAELLGLPETDLPKFQKQSELLLGMSAIGDDELMQAGTLANDELIDYFKEVIEAKRANPDQALISRLIAAEEEGDRLTAEEMHSTCVLLLIAGHETTTRLIGNGMYLLLQHPEQLEKLRENPGLAENAIEEMLRYEPPVQLMPRFAQEDTIFHGKKIKKNQLIVPMIGSANRDPKANDNPNVFDITRKDIKHVSFGYGIHLCLGMSLARIEGRVAINMLLERFPDMTMPDQKLDWTPIPLVRGMENLIIDTNEGKADVQSVA